ncbi:hypothetical protein DFJ68_2437 [Terracoccus luteus]|uniref:Uncharacterized protein n=1 Tax=Terracoccus luteus TaxID=53356 RepID=A0A495Y295_9MICO|nr:hypothetical protein [Terracoccus luteus]RKT78983.1 hypothetical protein DFJ68_2437 [Terracoccus luteus]
MSAPTNRPGRATWLRATAVLAITASVTLAAACSDEDTVDTVPPAWPTPTVDLPTVPVVPLPSVSGTGDLP